MSYVILDMMSRTELEQSLIRLSLSQTEAAQLLGVAPRTLRRWLEGEELPGPAEQAIRAWLRLHERRLPWRPDSTAIAERRSGPDRQTPRTRYQSQQHHRASRSARRPANALGRRSSALERNFGPMEVSFYTLTNGGFSLAHYTRKDGSPDVERDRELIEDAAYCIAKEFDERPRHTCLSGSPLARRRYQANARKIPFKRSGDPARLRRDKFGEFP